MVALNSAIGNRAVEALAKSAFDPSTSAPKAWTQINQELPMARKAFLTTDATREQVRSLAGVGVRQEHIATIIGCDAKTLRKHFRDELDRGMAEANAKIAVYLFDAAKGGNVAAQIFWLKARAHWRECKEPEKGSDAQPSSQTVIVLPDNNRDSALTDDLRKI